MWWTFLILVIIIFILLRKTNWYKGFIGEWSVNRILKRIAQSNGGLEMSDFMVKDHVSSSQIDNILLTQKALYVIEMKNYSGMIFGDIQQSKWTMTLKHVKKHRKKRKVYTKTFVSKHSFYSPVLQNQTHIKKLSGIISEKSLPVYNIVVFGKKAILKVSGTKKDTFIVSIKKLQKLINSLEYDLEKTLDLNHQMMLVDSLFNRNITDKLARKSHVNKLKAKYHS